MSSYGVPKFSKGKNKIFILGDNKIKHPRIRTIRTFFFVCQAKIHERKTSLNPDFEKTKSKPGYIILDVRTNNLASENNAERIAKSMVDLVKSPVKDYCSASISSITPKNDSLSIKVEG